MYSATRHQSSADRSITSTVVSGRSGPTSCSNCSLFLSNIMQLKKACSGVSSSWQKTQFGDATSPQLYSRERNTPCPLRNCVVVLVVSPCFFLTIGPNSGSDALSNPPHRDSRSILPARLSLSGLSRKLYPFLYSSRRALSPADVEGRSPRLLLPRPSTYFRDQSRPSE